MDGIPAGCIKVTIFASEISESEGTQIYEHGTLRDGTNDFQSIVDPGKHTVAISDNCGNDLRVITDVIAVPDKVNRDPRIQGLDLTGQVVPRILSLRIVDERGESVRASVQSGRISSQRRDAAGLVSLLMCGEDEEVTVWSAGYRTVRRRIPPGREDVVLLPGYQVRVQLGAESARAPDGWDLGVSMRVSNGQAPIAAFGSSGVAPLVLPELGAHVLTWVIKLSHQTGRAAWKPVDVVGTTFTVQDNIGEAQILEVSILREVLADARAFEKDE